jgi:hypothetical protein
MTKSNAIKIKIDGNYILVLSNIEVIFFVQLVIRQLNGILVRRKFLVYCERFDVEFPSGRIAIFNDEDESIHIETHDEDSCKVVFNILLGDSNFIAASESDSKLI